MAEPPFPADAHRSPPRLHLAHLDGLRAVAATIVFFNHAYAQVWNPRHVPPPEGALSAFAYTLVAGHLSVTVFIVISGYCLMLPVIRSDDRLKDGTRAFLWRRARRILPPYYAAVALSLVLIWTLIGQPTGSPWDVTIYADWRAILTHVLLLQDLYRTSSINYVFWSIAVEWQIYWLFPVLLLAWRRLGPAATLVATLVLGYGLHLGLDETRVARANPHFVGMFTLGMVAAFVTHSPRAEQTRWRSLPWHLLAPLGLAAACITTATWGVEKASHRFWVLDLPVGVMTASILVLMGRSERMWLRSILSWRPLVLMGAFSYSVYLIHAPVLQLIWQWLVAPVVPDRGTQFVLLSTLGFAFTLGLAYLFYLGFEAPFVRAAKRDPHVAATATT